MTDTESSSTTPPGPGRPQRRDAQGIETKERLLDAATAACIEHGYDGTTLSDIARRVDIKVPSIYNHYPNKTALLVAAARRAFDQAFGPLADTPSTPTDTVAFFLAPELHKTRRLVLELHSAGARHPDVAELLDAWYEEAAATWRPIATGWNSDTTVKSFFLILLGLCHLEDFSSVPGSDPVLREQISMVVGTLFESSAL